jgi:hypothetical protein
MLIDVVILLPVILARLRTAQILVDMDMRPATVAP